MADTKPSTTTKSRDSAGIAPPPETHEADPYLKSMALGLIEDSYLHTGTFTQFASEVMKVLVYAVTVPVAFTEGFLKSYLSIERIEETDDGQITIIPKAGARRRLDPRGQRDHRQGRPRAPCSIPSCAPSSPRCTRPRARP